MPRGGRKTGSENRKTVEREKAKKIAALCAEIWKNAPPIDFKAQLDSLDMMAGVMRHFYFRAMNFLRCSFDQYGLASRIISPSSGKSSARFNAERSSGSGKAARRSVSLAVCLVKPSRSNSSLKEVKRLDFFFPRPGPAARGIFASILPSFHRALIHSSRYGRRSSICFPSPASLIACSKA
jgi:hypothetical protein